VIGVVSTDQLKQFRRFVFVGILIFAAVLTPGGDPISLSVMSLPMYALYEIAIFIGVRYERGARERMLDKLEEDL